MAAGPEQFEQPIVVGKTDPVGLFQDIPGWIWRTFLTAWGVLFGLFVLFFATDAGARFAVTIAALFALMAFGLPMTLAALSRNKNQQFHGTVQTRSGPLSPAAAASQIALIPIAAVMGLIAFIILAK